MAYEWDPADPAADDEAVELATRIREGEGLDLLLEAVAESDDRTVHRALQLIAELDREYLVGLAAEAVSRITGPTPAEGRAHGW
jgi:hypothetical protein